MKAGGWLVVIAASLSTNPSGAPVSAQSAKAADATPAGALVSTYCVSCHNERDKRANLMLDTADSGHPANAAETWEKVDRQASQPRDASAWCPATGQRHLRAGGRTGSKVNWIGAAAAHVNPGRPGQLHRLNRTEYANAVRDLLGVEIDPSAMLPPDEQAHGFDTNADVLSMQPALLDRYLAAAAKIARLAVGDPTHACRASSVHGTAAQLERDHVAVAERAPRRAVSARIARRSGGAPLFPPRRRVRLQDSARPHGYGGDSRAPGSHRYRDSRRRSTNRTVDDRRDVCTHRPSLRTRTPDSTTPPVSADDQLEVRAPIKAGMRQVTATLVKSNSLAIEGVGLNSTPIWSREHTNKSDTPLMISALFIGGPYGGRVSATSPGRQRLYLCQPVDARAERACATKILSTLARRAYRRTPTSEEVRDARRLLQAARAHGDFDAGIRSASRARPDEPRFPVPD